MGTMTPAQRRALYESARFARETTYNGPLGPEYTPAGTRLQLWAPTAEQAAVNLYRKGHDSPCIGTLPLQRGPQGVWSIWLPGDQHGHYYTFTVTVDGVARETGDPYARAGGLNGLRSMIVDLARTAPAGWERDVRPVIPPARRSVWEVSVRDFSQDAASGVRPAWRGKFLAFTQTGTTLHGDGIHPTCLNYLKRLGVGYVQLMPIFDFGSVDEAKPLLRQYNWGYDPTNYNVPEGSYSTDPTKGEVRVRECKEMIAALHAAGIGVIMDVVYNHTAEGNNLGPTLSFKGIDNGAYYRLVDNDRRHYFDTTGTGNSLLMRSPHALQLITDSLRYWVTEMHVDGFRFDLAATLARQFQEVDKLSAFFDIVEQDPVISRVKLIAEPWDLGSGGYQVGGFPSSWSEWNGRYRDCVRDFWRSQPSTLPEFASRLLGSSDLYQVNGRRPVASVNFITAHDGFTMNDLVTYNNKHNMANGEDNRDGESNNRSWNCGVEGPTTISDVNNLRQRQLRNLFSTLLVSQGIPMICGGDEVERTIHE